MKVERVVERSALRGMVRDSMAIDENKTSWRMPWEQGLFHSEGKRRSGGDGWKGAVFSRRIGVLMSSTFT